MTEFSLPKGRPLIIALAGPNGAGKSTFYSVYLKPCGLPWINADELSREFGVDAYEAAQVADLIRKDLVEQRASFIFETVFSDPVGDRIKFLREASEEGYNVVLCFIGVASALASEQRVSVRVAEGGHDVPTEKLQARYARTMANLKLALAQLPDVRVYDNQDSRNPYRLVATSAQGRIL